MAEEQVLAIARASCDARCTLAIIIHRSNDARNVSAVTHITSIVTLGVISDIVPRYVAILLLRTFPLPLPRVYREQLPPLILILKSPGLIVNLGKTCHILGSGKQVVTSKEILLGGDV